MPPQERIVAASNRKARHDYTIGDVYEAGVVLQGTEVKSLREGKGNIRDAYASIDANELWLVNSRIEPYSLGNIHNHKPSRPRKLLLKRREIKKLIGLLKTKGVTIVPLQLYFNEKGMVKIDIGVATGKKQHEKRATIKDREWKRDQARIMKDQG